MLVARNSFTIARLITASTVPDCVSKHTGNKKTLNGVFLFAQHAERNFYRYTIKTGFIVLESANLGLKSAYPKQKNVYPR